MLDAIGDAINSEWTGAWAFRQFDRGGFDPDPNFAIDNEDMLRQLTDGLDPDMYSAFDAAVSLPHALKIRQQALGVQESRRRLASLGWKGAALNIGANILDPSNIVVGAATGGIQWAARGGRLARLVRGGLVAGATETTIQGYLASQDPQRDVGDVLTAGMSAFVIGGSLNAVIDPTRFARVSESVQRQVELRDIMAANRPVGEALANARTAMGAASPLEFTPEWRARLLNETLTESGRTRFASTVDEKTRRAFADEVIRTLGMDDEADADTIRLLREADPDLLLSTYMDNLDLVDNEAGGNVSVVPPIKPPKVTPGEAPPPPPDPISIPAQFRFDPQNVTDAKSDNVIPLIKRWDMVGALGLSDSPPVRIAANLLAQNALLRRTATGEYAPTVGSASEWKRRASRILAIQHRREVLGGQDEWLRANGYTGLRADEGRRVFQYAIADAMRSPESLRAATPAVRKAAEAQLRIQDMPLMIVKAHGVKGADKIDPQANYLTRLWSDVEVNNVLAEIGDAGGDETWLHGYFSRAIKSAQPDIDQELADKMGKGMVQRIRRLGDDTDIDKAKMFSADNEDAVRAVLEMEGSMTKEQVDAAVRRLLPPDPEKGVGARLKSRVLLDENYADVMPNGQTLRMSRLMENDAEKLFHIYTNQMLGAAAEAVVFRKVSEAMGLTGGRAIETYNDFRRVLKADMKANGLTPKQIERDLSKIDTLWRHVRGIRQTGVIDPDSGTARALRVVRALNNLRIAGGFGIAQATEMGTVTGEAGVGTMLRSMPALDGIMRDAKTGNLSSPLLSELEAVTAIGGDRYIDQVLVRMDGTGGAFDRNIGRLETAIHRGNRIQNDISGLAGIDAISRRIAVVAAVQRIADAAYGAKTLSAKRLGELGMTPAQADRVYAMLKNPKYVETITGSHGRSVHRLNLDKWSDQAAAAQFITAVDKWANRVVQTNDIGMLSNWMTGELGKTIMQFRNFVAGAWTKQTLHKIQMADMQAFGGAAGSWLLASLVYVGETYIRSLGREDADEYRNTRLSTGNIIAQSAARSGWTSLAPMTIDNMWGLTGGDPVFQLSRYTGLASGGGLSGTLLQNPTTSLIDASARAVRATGNYIRGIVTEGEGGLSQSDAASFISLLPFQRLIGVNNVLDHVKTGLPER